MSIQRTVIVKSGLNVKKIKTSEQRFLISPRLNFGSQNGGVERRKRQGYQLGFQPKPGMHPATSLLPVGLGVLTHNISDHFSGLFCACKCEFKEPTPMPGREAALQSLSPLFVGLVISLQPLCFISQLTSVPSCPLSQFSNYGLFTIMGLLVSSSVNVKQSALSLHRRSH